ncbi:MAG: helix-turn-helix transcriptional regulator [Gammaproteobacteria bacterium]|nr:helix-turn-helix transcriptional regulator [Gammaproteobacteria bacterium]
MHPSKFFKQRRLALGLTQREVAEIAGVTIMHVSCLERGARADAERTARIADALRISPMHLCAMLVAKTKINET